jgi:hypothetical protein
MHIHINPLDIISVEYGLLKTVKHHRNSTTIFSNTAHPCLPHSTLVEGSGSNCGHNKTNNFYIVLFQLMK